MDAVKARENIWYVGVLDTDLRVFDIVMSTHRGTTYNAYLIRGSEKTVLVETVKDHFCEEFLAGIRGVCSLAEIDYIVMSHTEPDHSGCLQRVLAEAPNATVLGSQAGINFLGEIINEPFRSQVVTEQDSIDIGGMTLQFFVTPMLHWPDTIFMWVPEAKTLFSCDCFGCHFADARIFNDLMGDVDFSDAYWYYFHHIMGPFKNPYMLNALDKIDGLDIELAANGHGPVLRRDIPRYLALYREWSGVPPRGEKRVALAYVSAYGYTKSLAEAVLEGLQEGGVKDVRVLDLGVAAVEEARATLAGADGILLGSPTLMGDAPPPLYEALVGLNPIIHRGCFGGAFGSYGWSGEAARNLLVRMNQLHLTVPLPEFRVRFKPTEADFAAARQFGSDFAKALLGEN